MWDNSCANFRSILYLDLEISRWKLEKFLKSGISYLNLLGISLRIYIGNPRFQKFLELSPPRSRDLVTGSTWNLRRSCPTCSSSCKKILADGVASFMFKSTWKKKLQKCSKIIGFLTHLNNIVDIYVAISIVLTSEKKSIEFKIQNFSSPVPRQCFFLKLNIGSLNHYCNQYRAI